MFNNNSGNLQSAAVGVPCDEALYRKRAEQEVQVKITAGEKLLALPSPRRLTVVMRLRDYSDSSDYVLASVEEADAIRTQFMGNADVLPMPFLFIVDVEGKEYTLRASDIIGIRVEEFNLGQIAREVQLLKEQFTK